MIRQTAIAALTLAALTLAALGSATIAGAQDCSTFEGYAHRYIDTPVYNANNPHAWVAQVHNVGMDFAIEHKLQGGTVEQGIDAFYAMVGACGSGTIAQELGTLDSSLPYVGSAEEALQIFQGVAGPDAYDMMAGFIQELNVAVDDLENGRLDYASVQQMLENMENQTAASSAISQADRDSMLVALAIGRSSFARHLSRNPFASSSSSSAQAQIALRKALPRWLKVGLVDLGSGLVGAGMSGGNVLVGIGSGILGSVKYADEQAASTNNGGGGTVICPDFRCTSFNALTGETYRGGGEG